MGLYESLNPQDGRSAGSVQQITDFFAKARKQREEAERYAWLKKAFGDGNGTPGVATAPMGNTPAKDLAAHLAAGRDPDVQAAAIAPHWMAARGSGQSPARPAAIPLGVDAGEQTADDPLTQRAAGIAQVRSAEAPGQNPAIPPHWDIAQQQNNGVGSMLEAMEQMKMDPVQAFGWIMGERSTDRKASIARAQKEYENELGITRDAARIKAEGENQAALDDRRLERELQVALTKAGLKPEGVDIQDVSINEGGKPVVHRVAVDKGTGKVVWNTRIGEKYERDSGGDDEPEDFIVNNEYGFPIGVDARMTAKQKTQMRNHLDQQETRWTTRLESAQKQLQWMGRNHPERATWEKDAQDYRNKLQMIDNKRAALEKPIQRGTEPGTAAPGKPAARPAAAPAQHGGKLYRDPRSGHTIRWNPQTKTWDTVQ